ncbi:PASTA domain-containing protein [bacterium]|nr:PASTA domain-containing protein [bacterium]
MSKFSAWFVRHGQTIKGWLVTLAILFVWMLLMDWVVMPLYTQYSRERELPDITEHSFENAREILESNGFRIIKDREKTDSRYAKGMVIFQNPPPYSKVKRGRRIYVTVSSGARSVAVPQLVGVSERDAAFILNNASLVLGNIQYAFDDYYPQGVVCRQSVVQDTEVDAKTVVDITVSRGNLPSRFIVPKLVGKNIDTARKMLWEAGLETGRIESELSLDLVPGTVIAQSVAAGTEVSQGKAVSLTISRVE